MPRRSVRAVAVCCPLLTCGSLGAADQAVWHGFAELAAGIHVRGGAHPTDASLGELRANAAADWAADRWALSVAADFVEDQALGEASVDVRELAVRIPLTGAMEIEAGRQVLSWGTGDLLFLNDLFPKDLESLFAGRDESYVQAPSTALSLRASSRWVDVDLVWTPEFEPDRYLDGERFSLFDPVQHDVAVLDVPLSVDRPEGLDSGEFAVRLSRRHGDLEWALYFNHGFFKTPTARNRRGRAAFAPVAASGFSILGPVGGGVASLEGAWYESRDDGSGFDPRVPNSQGRALVGYQHPLSARLTGGVQVYVERNDDVEAMRTTAFDPDTVPDQWRWLWTMRMTYLAPGDTLTLGLFVLNSPSDRDYYLRPTVGVRLGRRWQVFAGANLFGGHRPWTAFGEHENDSNVFVRLRRTY